MNLNNLIFDMASLSGTVEDAVDRLIMLLNGEQRGSVAIMKEIDLHYRPRAWQSGMRLSLHDEAFAIVPPNTCYSLQQSEYTE